MASRRWHEIEKGPNVEQVVRHPGGFPVVGIIGGGQLARMCQPPAVGLSLTLAVLSEGPQAAAALVVPNAPVGAHDDVETVREFARQCDVVTFDHEHVPPEVLAALEEDGVPLHPRPSALRYAQDKLAMRERLGDLVDGPDAFGEEIGFPLVLKTPRGGYDGKGVRMVSTADDVADCADWFERAGSDPLLAEEAVDFTREIAVLIARSPSGQAAAWPVVETVQTDGICTEVLAPAPDLAPETAELATLIGLELAGALQITGVFAVELFDTARGPLINELAMRPHNSGHWSMDGAVTGQFEQHLRAVLDLPLGSPRARAPFTVMANVLGGEYEDLYPAYRHLMAREPELKVHLYGKSVRPGRKIGHVNLSGDDLADLRDRAGHAADYLQGVVTE